MPLESKGNNSKILSSIDIGSNSILLLCAEVSSEKIENEILNESSITGLGKDLDKNHSFLESVMNDSFEALKNYRELLRKQGITPSEVIVTATEASRVASNSKQFFEKVYKQLGFNVHIISGEGEAYYSALGVYLGSKNNVKISPNEMIMMDVGGASTELISVSIHPLVINSSISLPIGSVRAFSWKKENLYDENLNKIIKTNRNDIKNFSCQKIYAIAGTMTTLGGMFLNLKNYDDKKVNGLEITIDQFTKLIEENNKKSPTQLLQEFPFLGKRCETVVTGGMVALRLAQELDVKSLQVSTYGLRYGSLFEGGIKNEFIIWRAT